MGYVIAAFASVVFFAGLLSQLVLATTSVHGAGASGQLSARSTASAQVAAFYADRCLNAAALSPGAVDTALVVDLTIASGGSVSQPIGAKCYVGPGVGAPGREVYASVPIAPGMARAVVDMTHASAVWFAVHSQGLAVNLADGSQLPVPAAIPAGSLLSWSHVSF